MAKSKNAIVICSGGLDSVVTAFYAKKKQNYAKIIILFFDYGQKSIKQEKKYSSLCAKSINAEFVEINLDWLGKISHSLINKPGKIKKLTRKDLKDTQTESNKFYVPGRNTLFISYALALADALWIKKKEEYDILLGFKCEGKESYPDTTEEFVEKMNALAKRGYSKKNKVLAPLIKMDKEDIILLGQELGVDFKKTFSCYNPLKSNQCGFCLACKLRQEGFYWANIKDPTSYYNN